MTTRRQFLQASSAGLVGLAMTSSNAKSNDYLSQPQAKVPHSMGADSPDAQLWAKEGKPIKAALIGCGWYGKSDLFRLIQCGGEKVEVVALCDVDAQRLTEAGTLVAQRQASGATPRLYKDYRDLLSKETLDVCLVGTPDHWHALPMIAACEAGCDVYVQKPISVDVVEAKAMLNAARKHNRVVQVGMQRRSTPILCDAKKKYFDSGEIGKVAMVNVFDTYSRGVSKLQPEPVPPELDYEMWVGPAPMRPFFNMQQVRRWRAFMEYGNGTIGDMGVHMFDMARWLLNLRWPSKIVSAGGIYVQKDGDQTYFDTQKSLFFYDDLVMEWSHKHWSEPTDPRIGWGAEIFGDKGTFKGGSMAYDWKPRGKGVTQVDSVLEYEAYPSDATEPGLERRNAGANRAHMWNFLARTVDRQRPVSDIEEGYISTACCILANISTELGGEVLEFDPDACVVKGNDKATDKLRRPYRAPWKHPEI